MINDSSVRTAAANIAASPVLTDDDVLFEFQVYKVMLIEYDHDGRRTVQKWDQEERNSIDRLCNYPTKTGELRLYEGNRGYYDFYEWL